MGKTPKPGMYNGVPFEEYRAWEAINHSTLKAGLRSMAHLRYAIDNPDASPPTPAQRFGTLIHTAALEPLTMLERVVIEPDWQDEIRKPDGRKYANVKNTKEYKEAKAKFEAEHSGLTPVTADEFETIKAVVSGLQSDDRAYQWLCADRADTEVSIVWDQPTTDGAHIRCKARIDRLPRSYPYILDIKTTIDAGKFNDQIARYRYHQQMAMYCAGIESRTGGRYAANLIAIEKEPPYGVRAATLSDDAMRHGRNAFQRVLAEYYHCLQTDQWPGYESPDYWHLPGWATAEALHADAEPVKENLACSGRI